MGTHFIPWLPPLASISNKLQLSSEQWLMPWSPERSLGMIPKFWFEVWHTKGSWLKAVAPPGGTIESVDGEGSDSPWINPQVHLCLPVLSGTATPWEPRCHGASALPKDSRTWNNAYIDLVLLKPRVKLKLPCFNLLLLETCCSSGWNVW